MIIRYLDKFTLCDKHMKYSNTAIDKLINSIPNSVSLYQETNDKEQLNPKNRIQSIYNVLQWVKKSIWEPRTAIDIGSWFWYWTIILSILWIQSIGIENVKLKCDQAIKLFINLRKINNLTFNKKPWIINKDFLQLNTHIKVDLLTAFYISPYMVEEDFLLKCKTILNPEGKILLWTNLDIESVNQILAQRKDMKEIYNIEVVNIESNFEQTAIILKTKK